MCPLTPSGIEKPQEEKETCFGLCRSTRGKKDDKGRAQKSKNLGGKEMSGFSRKVRGKGSRHGRGSGGRDGLVGRQQGGYLSHRGRRRRVGKDRHRLKCPADERVLDRDGKREYPSTEKNQ